MSENNQNNRPAPENGKKEYSHGKGGQWHKNRHRPYKGNRPRQDNAAQATEQVQKPVEATREPVRENEQKPRPAHQNNQNQNRDQRRGGNQNRGRGYNDRKPHHDDIHTGGKNRKPYYITEKRPYDPYEKPSREEIELSELRAQIVLKAADGTTPTVYGAPPKPAPTPVKEEAKEEREDAIPAIANEVEPDDAPLSPAPETPTPVEEGNPKTEVVGVRFRSAGKMYYFDPHGISAKKGDFAIVETTRGPEFGDVCLENTMVNANDTVAPLRPLIRIATPADIAHNQENREKEKEALVICQEKIRAHGLGMKLIDVQYAFDNSKLLFYFSAEGRVDFRELVKDLASVFRTRIELRQIGIRDEAKMLGGIGACGRALCCSTFLPDFAQVSIKMAKEQNLSLNSTKISGVCGRLMCCLRYESDVYAEEIRKTPPHDALVRTEDGIGTVISSNPLAGTVRVVLRDAPDSAPKQYHRDAVTVLPKERKNTEHTQQNDKKEGQD